jgi:RND family efflux transporter MFP subunit
MAAGRSRGTGAEMNLARLLGALLFAAAATHAVAQTGGDQIRVLLTPELETTLVSPILGRVRAVNVTLGAGFQKGRVLVDFDCQEQQARVNMGKAEVVAAREQHEAKLRLQGLQQAGDVEVNLAAAALEKAQAQVELYRTQANQCVVTAPFSGRAVKVHVKPFQGVQAGAPLVEIVSSGPFKLRLNVPSKWLGWIKPGTPFEVTIDETGKTYAARITAINARVDAASQSIEIEGSIENRGGELLAGMSGAARFKPPR